MASISTFVEKEGFLWVKRLPVKQLKLKAWQWKYCVLKKCSGYKHSACFEWYESPDAFLAHSSPKNLKFDLIKLVSPWDDTKKEFAFIVYTSDFSYKELHQLQLATKTEAERVEWMETLNQFTSKEKGSCSRPSEQSQAAQYMYKFPKPNSLNLDISKTSYPVKFQESTLNPGLLKIKGDYLLQVCPKHVSLLTNGVKEPQKNVLSWPLATIKSYCSSTIEGNPSMKVLVIETGRQSSTGSGVFHFLTPFSDKIANHIRLNINRTLLQKMHSQESIEYSSSPENSSPKFPSSYRTPCDAMPRKLSVKSPDRVQIPFQEYDGGTNEESFATYIPHDNGYIHVLTAQEAVDKFQRKSSRTSFSGHELTSTIDDDNTYIKVLGDDEPSEQIYLEVLAEDEESVQNPESPGGGGRFRNPESTGGGGRFQNHESLGGGGGRFQNLESPGGGGRFQNHESPGGGGRFQNPESPGGGGRFQNPESPGGAGRSGGGQVVRKQENEMQFMMDVTTKTTRWFSQTSHTSSMEYSSLSSENEVFARERDTSISDVFPEELTTFSDGLATFSEHNNNVLVRPRGENCEPANSGLLHKDEKDQWHDPPETHASVEDASVEHASEEHASEEHASEEHASEGHASEEHASEEHASEEHASEEHASEEHASEEHASEEHASEEHASEEHASEEHASEEHASEKHASEEHASEEHASEEHASEEHASDEHASEEHARSAEDKHKTNSWHSATGSDIAETSETHDDSTNTSSASDGGNVQDSQEISEEEAPDSEAPPRRNSLPRQSFSGVNSFKRQRSFTTSDLQDLLKRVATAQDFLQKNANDDDVTRESEVQSPEDCLGLDVELQNTIVDQLTNPTAAQQSNSFPKRNRHSAGDIKYLCSECGWYKRSRKKSVWRKEKKCERCFRVIQKSAISTEQKEPKSPKKEKSTRLLSRITRKLTERNCVENMESTRDDTKPLKPQPQPSFLKNLHAHITVHHPTLDSKRSEIGIAPSLFHTFTALSITSESRTLSKNTPISNENALPIPKAPLTSSKSDGAITACQLSPQAVKKKGSAHSVLTKSLTCDLGSLAVNPLTRTMSSPMCVAPERSSDMLTTESRYGDEKPPRKLSCGNLPPLPENNCAESTTPPAIPPRTREEAPPLPPRRTTGLPARRGDSTKLRRGQTDPGIPLGRISPVLQDDHRLVRAITEPDDSDVTSDEMRNALSLGNLLESGQEEKPEPKTTLITVMSQSLGEGLDTTPPQSSPPPLPPRKGSIALPTTSPRRASVDNGLNSFGEQSSGSFESPNLPENGSPGRPSEKPPLNAKRSLEAKRDFKMRNPLYSERVDDDDEEDINPS